MLSRKSNRRDRYGKAVYYTPVKTPCSVVKLEVSSVASSVRADSSASRGAAEQEEAAANLLFPPNVKIAIDDIVVVANVRLRITMTHQRFHAVTGSLDHIEVGAAIAEQPS
jgi:hypothetical protein